MHWQTFFFIWMHTNAYVIKTLLCFFWPLFTLTFFYLKISSGTKVWWYLLLYFEDVYHTRMIEPYANANTSMVRMVHIMLCNYEMVQEIKKFNPVSFSYTSVSQFYPDNSLIASNLEDVYHTRMIETYAYVYHARMLRMVHTMNLW